MAIEQVMSPLTRRRWGLVALVALALLARMILIRQAYVYPAGSWLIDSGDYLALADSIRLRGEFTTGPDDNYDRAIGYPLFLAGFLSLPSKGLETALAAQQLLVVAECALLYWIGRLTFGVEVGWAAALWLALSPNSIFWAGTIMSETLSAFWLAAAFLLFAQSLRVLGAASGAGVSLGLATLTRPIALYLLPIWTALALAVGLRGPAWRQRLKIAGLFLVGGGLVIGLWVGRNYQILGRAIISTSPARTLRDFQLARVVAAVEGVSRDDAVALMAAQPDATAYGWRVARENPGTFLAVNGFGILRTALGTELGTWLIALGYVYPGTGMLEAVGQGSLPKIAEAARILIAHPAGWVSIGLLGWGLVYTCGVFLSGALGLLRTSSQIRSARWMAVGVALTSAAYLILIPLANGDARFRVPAEPFLAFLAGLARWKAEAVDSGEPSVLEVERGRP